MRAEITFITQAGVSWCEYFQEDTPSGAVRYAVLCDRCGMHDHAPTAREAHERAFDHINKHHS